MTAAHVGLGALDLGLVGLFGSVILVMAVDTAYVASAELLERIAHRHRFRGGSVSASMDALLELIEEKPGGRDVTIHQGWPTSSWLDRMATGVLVANTMRLPQLHPHMRFAIESAPRMGAAPATDVAHARVTPA